MRTVVKNEGKKIILFKIFTFQSVHRILKNYYQKMQFLSANSLLYIRVVFLLTIVFYLITDPEGLCTAGFVVLMGQAMQVPLVQLSKSNPMLGITAMTFTSLAIGDVIPLLAQNFAYFESLVPIRLAGYFILAGYIYFVPTSMVSNSLVITFAFLEVWFNFLIFNNLRDEKYYRMKKFVEENAEAMQRAHDEQVRVIEEDE